MGQTQKAVPELKTQGTPERFDMRLSPFHVGKYKRKYDCPNKRVRQQQ